MTHRLRRGLPDAWMFCKIWSTVASYLLHRLLEEMAQVGPIAEENVPVVYQSFAPEDRMHARQTREGNPGIPVVIDVIVKVQIGKQQRFPPARLDQRRRFRHGRLNQVVLVLADRAPANDDLENGQQRQ